MIREYLKKMFPLLPTVEERREFIGPLGRWFDAKNKLCPYNDFYPSMIAVSVVYRISAIIGALLLVMCFFLSVKGIDVDHYTAAVFSDKFLRASGMTGLYVYYYCRIMTPVIFSVVAMCFCLFLIHVKRGQLDPLRNSSRFRLKEDRTFKKKSILLFNTALAGAIVCWVAPIAHLAYLSLADEVGLIKNMAGLSIIWWSFSYIAIGFCYVSFALLLYASAVLSWAVIFRYDVAYERAQMAQKSSN